jgi:GTP-binding protein EngB required for normal cell division
VLHQRKVVLSSIEQDHVRKLSYYTSQLVHIAGKMDKINDDLMESKDRRIHELERELDTPLKPKFFSLFSVVIRLSAVTGKLRFSSHSGFM